jgi:putative flippase GtrA
VNTTATRIETIPLAVRYALFASAASSVNLLTQFVVLSVMAGPDQLLIAMVLGTIAGIVPKYFLDKRWIFYDSSAGLSNHARKFTIYALLSVLTTLIFWVSETLFDWLGHGGPLHYVGAVIGLAIGYWIKYRLDLSITFGRPAS